MSGPRVPPYDPIGAAGLAQLAAAGSAALNLEALPQLRAATVHEDISDFGLEEQDRRIPGYDGATIEVTVYRRPAHAEPGPGVLEHGAVAVSVEYRLAPEYPDPFPVEDCYAALTWMAGNAAMLGIDPSKVIVAGGRAGAGLAAGVALLARDRQGPAIAGQVLMCPMLDDRDATVSTRQFEDSGTWSARSNRVGWEALLGERRGGKDVSVYAAPARATDLSNLPAAFIDCGSAEVFRDEDVAYASAIWRDGGIAELHVWPGGTHGWEMFMAGTQMGQQAGEARNAWVRRLLAG